MESRAERFCGQGDREAEIASRERPSSSCSGFQSGAVVRTYVHAIVNPGLGRHAPATIGYTGRARGGGEGSRTMAEDRTLLAERRSRARPASDEQAKAALERIAAHEAKTLVQLVEELHSPRPLAKGESP